MSAELPADGPTNVESMFGSHATPISDELGKLTTMLAQICPPDAVIAFQFDGKLRLSIDIRRFEEMTTIEAQLPLLYGGIFHEVQRVLPGHGSFFHRLSAIVAR